MDMALGEEGLLMLLLRYVGGAAATGRGEDSGSGLGMDLGRDWRMGEWNLACAATTTDSRGENVNSWG